MKAKIDFVINWLRTKITALRASIKRPQIKVSKKFLWRATIVLGLVVLGVVLAAFLWQTPEFRMAVGDTKTKLGNSVRSVQRRLTPRKSINLLVMQEAVMTDPDGVVVGIQGDTIPAEASVNGRTA